jgi:hypothetical protein
MATIRKQQLPCSNALVTASDKQLTETLREGAAYAPSRIRFLYEMIEGLP